MKDKPRPAFRARVVEPKGLRQQLEGAEGVAEIAVAVTNIPDSAVAYGNTRIQVIDESAFDAWLVSKPFGDRTAQMFVDHGDALTIGAFRSIYKIGYVDDARMEAGDLVINANYNLEKGVGRDAFSDLVHDPTGVQFSFSWDPDNIKTELRSGHEHVTEIWPQEFSQVGIGAQQAAHLVSARTAGRALKSLDAIPMKIRGAWWDQVDDVEYLFKSYAYVEEVFGDDRKPERGHVIAASDDGRYAKVPWEINDDDEVLFDFGVAEELKISYIPTGNGLAGSGRSMKAALTSSAGRQMLRAAMDDELKEVLVEAIAAQDDPIAAFYGTMIDVAKTHPELASGL